MAEQAEGAACNEAGAEEEPIAESAEAEGEEPACAGSPHVLLEAAAPEAGAAEEPGAEEPAAADASSPPPEAEPAGKGPAASGAASGVKKPAVGLKRKGFAVSGCWRSGWRWPPLACLVDQHPACCCRIMTPC